MILIDSQHIQFTSQLKMRIFGTSANMSSSSIFSSSSTSAANPEEITFHRSSSSFSSLKSANIFAKPNKSPPKKLNLYREHVFLFLTASQYEVFSQSKEKTIQRRCIGGNPLIAVCTNPECDSAFICSKEDCQQCANDSHLTCQKNQIKGISRLVSRHVDKEKQFLDRMFQEVHRLEQRLKDLKRSIENIFYYGNLQKQYRKTLASIYDCNSGSIFQRKPKIISGKQAKDLYTRLNDKKVNAQFQFSTLAQYQHEIDQITSAINFLPERLEDILKTSQDTQRQLSLNLDSRILTNNTLNELLHRNSIFSQFPNPFANSLTKFQLLFRASQHDFKAGQFHKLCDDTHDTFTLIKTQFDVVIGCYSHYEWNKPNNQKWVDDIQQKAFIILLKNGQHSKIYKPNNHRHLIKCDAAMGPCFGTDIMLSDKCNINPSSCAFPDSYDTGSIFGKTYKTKTEQIKMLCGSSDGIFKVKQYEVFKVVK